MPLMPEDLTLPLQGESIYPLENRNHYKALTCHTQAGLHRSSDDLTYPVIATETRGYVDRTGSYHLLGTEASHYAGDEFALKHNQPNDTGSVYGLLAQADYTDGLSHLNNRVITHKDYHTLGTTLTMSATAKTVGGHTELPLGKAAINLLTGESIYQEDPQHIRTTQIYD